MQNSVLPTASDSFGSIFVTAFRLFRENLALIFGFLLLTSGPSIVLGLIGNATTDTELLLYINIASLIWYSAFVTLSILLISVLILNKTENAEKSRGQIIINTFKILLKSSYTLLLQSFFMILLLLLFVVPGIIYGIYWLFANKVTLLTGKFGKDALMHSKELVKGRWWPTFGKFIGISLLASLTNLLIKTVLFFIIGTIDSLAYTLPNLFLTILLSFFHGLLFLAMYLNYEATANKTQPAANTLN
ncbi:hypothetical protein KA036_02460 [Candidatus Gracilibacteria bacterium]|jgi:hypothetical protein|nr:hypothetical protein [Candidatus Gracilibacteria bacterium]